jgi:hypothetical protein
MKYSPEYMEKMQANIRTKCAEMAEGQGQMGGALGQAGVNRVYGDSDALTNRIKRQLAQARKESETLHHLQELEELLEKYPDIARMLDLLNYVGQTE